MTIQFKQKVSALFPYDFTGEIMQVVNHFGLDIVKQDYTADGIHMLFEVPIAKVGEVSKGIIERRGGKIKLEKD